ncbi:membrane-spanning 4-domains subfamily A member 4A-like isoform X2 [Sinocyclocheilus anshuiensis]|uniref:Membrane-spanning 4-domains subfamily A member 4A-like n=2 Tax=Sinocyclocheilus anshuiensis TaxID=1608454 RepID=A0A671M5N5_9TELE|nr:PREDICTED: membrane-spanning 4-domains subfamily A member 4A-like isoform X2 [Sinocyclocheilus anshuiensis]
MESSKFMSTDKATVIIQVNPQVKQDNAICDDEQQARGAYHSTALKGFFKAQPKALGTVQIMIGVVIFLFGIVCTTSINTFESPIFIFSGITYWGSLIYISAGSLSVAAQKKLHLCVVKASLGMNVISAITAAIAITLMAIEIHHISTPYRRCTYNYDYNDNRTDTVICSKLKSNNMGITGVLLVFSILQFIISIFISGFACKATCNTDSTVVNVALNQGY